jgi:hypothetical protein
MKLTSREIALVRSRLRGTLTSVLVRLVAGCATDDDRDALMQGVRDGGSHDTWCDKYRDAVSLAACEIDDRVPMRL